MSNPANTTPFFSSVPDIQGAAVTTANTDVTGASGTVATIFTAAANGSRIDSVRIKGIVAEGATQAADTVRFFLSNPTGPSIYALTETNFAAGGGVVSATVPNVEAVIGLGIDLPAGWALLATTHAGGATAKYHVTAYGADY